MSSLKNLFFIAVLGAAACGVYVTLNRNGESSSVPPGVCETCPGLPKVEMPGGVGGVAPPFASPPAAGRSPPGMPGFPSLPGNPSSVAASAPAGAAPVGQTATADEMAALRATAPAGDTAPRFVPPSPPTASLPLPTPSSPPPSAAVADPPLPSSPDNSAQSRVPSAKVESILQTVGAKLDEGRLAEAHLALSSLYGNPEVPAEHAREVARLLDQLAATVIFSRQHLLEPPYRVKAGDTLQQIADMYNVPPQLLARINGIRDLQNLTPSRELKVMQGPFSAKVDLEKLEMTLMLNGRYAGRFPIGIGPNPPKLEGSFTVRDKRADAANEDPRTANSTRDPARGARKLWIDLGNQIGIQGTDGPLNMGRAESPGSICLGNQDMDDLFGILSVGSRVVIQR